MSKVIVISGCKDCQYLNTESRVVDYCEKFDEITFWDGIPETPHPNCKLNDLPDIADINYFASSISKTVKKARTEGADFVINQITK